MQDSVTVAEGSALHVLPGEADVVTLEQQSTERQGLRRTPVYPLTVHDSLRVGAKKARQHVREGGRRIPSKFVAFLYFGSHATRTVDASLAST